MGKGPAEYHHGAFPEEAAGLVEEDGAGTCWAQA